MKIWDKFFSRESFLIVPIGFVASLLVGGAASAATKTKAKKQVIKKVIAPTKITPSASPTPTPSASPAYSEQASATPTPSATQSASPTPTPTPPPAGVNIGASALVASGKSKLFTISGNKIFITRSANGLTALSNVCTHQGCEISRSGSDFACPCHGAQFSVETGEVKGGPARSPLRSFKVAEFQGDIYVAI
jgi:nitrite reductase/ring-hydroxylating ferredoxin subunit